MEAEGRVGESEVSAGSERAAAGWENVFIVTVSIAVVINDAAVEQQAVGAVVEQFQPELGVGRRRKFVESYLDLWRWRRAGKQLCADQRRAGAARGKMDFNS